MLQLISRRLLSHLLLLPWTVAATLLLSAFLFNAVSRAIPPTPPPIAIHASNPMQVIFPVYISGFLSICISWSLSSALIFVIKLCLDWMQLNHCSFLLLETIKCWHIQAKLSQFMILLFHLICDHDGGNL